MHRVPARLRRYGMSGDRSKIVERIRKLLALADDKGATEAEAVAAVMMAQRLMAENDVAD